MFDTEMSPVAADVRTIDQLLDIAGIPALAGGGLVAAVVQPLHDGAGRLAIKDASEDLSDNGGFRLDNGAVDPALVYDVAVFIPDGALAAVPTWAAIGPALCRRIGVLALLPNGDLPRLVLRVHRRVDGILDAYRGGQ